MQNHPGGRRGMQKVRTRAPINAPPPRAPHMPGPHNGNLMCACVNMQCLKRSKGQEFSSCPHDTGVLSLCVGAHAALSPPSSNHCYSVATLPSSGEASLSLVSHSIPPGGNAGGWRRRSRSLHAVERSERSRQ